MILFSTNILRKQSKESFSTKNEEKVFFRRDMLQRVCGGGGLTCTQSTDIGLFIQPLRIWAPLPTQQPKDLLSSQTRPPILSLLSTKVTFNKTEFLTSDFQMRQKQKLNWVQLLFKKPYLSGIMTNILFNARSSLCSCNKKVWLNSDLL